MGRNKCGLYSVEGQLYSPRDCLSLADCSWKSGLGECEEETYAFMPAFVVRPFTLQREVIHLWLKYLHLFCFFSPSQSEAGQPALPHRWFPIKIINNNVGTLFLERRFVSVPKWANRAKISCYTLSKSNTFKAKNPKQNKRKGKRIFIQYLITKTWWERKRTQEKLQDFLHLKQPFCNIQQKCFNTGWCRGVSSTF